MLNRYLSVAKFQCHENMTAITRPHPKLSSISSCLEATHTGAAKMNQL